MNSTKEEMNEAFGDTVGRKSSNTMQSMDLFEMARSNDFDGIEGIIDKEECSPDDRDDVGRTALHICAYHGHLESTQKLITLGASLNLPDFESGWTPLHRALYHGHLKVSLLLIKAGASLGDNWRSSNDDWKTVVQPKKEPYRTIRNISKWRCPIDHDGLSPLDLLSYRLADNLKSSKKLRSSTSIHAFGKSDFMLGVPLPRAADIVRPKRLEKFATEDISCVKASKYHSMALTICGDVYTWGHGRSGRLGHGDESTQPTPTIIEAFVSMSIKIKAISAAENHSLAISTTGDVFSWGSNRYGQLGHNGSDNGMCSTPRRIDYLKRMNVICVAAGTTHSLCFTDDDHIYAWGSNKHAQLGIRSTESTSLSNGSGPGSAIPKRVSLGPGNGGNSSQRSKLVIISLAAGTYNSLVLVKNPNLSHFGHISLNEVYQWGHGCVSPMKVHFNISNGRKERCPSSPESTCCENRMFFGPSPRREIVNISAGMNHNCAVSSDGHLYTWGLGSDQLGHGEDDHVHQLSSPQLVEALLPENGGGRVMQASASNTHTCVVTDRGDVYSWGSSIELPESSGTFQPVPRRVVGIKRAVQVASGADHTIVLCTASLPPLPHGQPQPSQQHQVSTPVRGTKKSEKPISSSSLVLMEDNTGTDSHISDVDDVGNDAQVKEILTLKQLCEIQIAKSVDISNVANVLQFATQIYSTDLTTYCSSLILKNLDGVLMQCRPNDLDTLISDTLEAHRFRRHSSGSFASVGSGRGSRPRSGTGVSESDVSDAEMDADSNRIQKDRGRRISSLSKDEVTLEGITRFVKQTKKRLLAICELEKKLADGKLAKEELQSEQIAKLERKTILESELKRLELIMTRLENEERLKSKAKLAQIRMRNEGNLEEFKEKSAFNKIIVDGTSDDNASTQINGASGSIKAAPSHETSAGLDQHRCKAPAATSSCTKRSKGRMQAVSLTSMTKRATSTGQPPPSFEEWLNVSAPKQSMTPSSSVWGKADMNGGDARIDLKDVISSQSEVMRRTVCSPQTEITVSPINHANNVDCVAPQSTPTPKKSSGGKKVKVSLAEFMGLSEKKNISSSKPAPWSASKTANNVMPSSSPQALSASISHADHLSSVASKLSFAEIQQQEEELRKQSNIKNLEGNENPWFIARIEKAESLDVIMAKQQSEAPLTPSEGDSATKLRAVAPEFTPCLLQSSLKSKSSPRKIQKDGSNISSRVDGRRTERKHEKKNRGENTAVAIDKELVQKSKDKTKSQSETSGKDKKKHRKNNVGFLEKSLRS